ncbi:Nucleotidyltransferase [Candidatus Magnetomoraceae bacterium gMMP-15]
MAEIPNNIKESLLNYIDDLSKVISIKSAFLFGSYAKGNWKKDIDIAIFSNYFERMDSIEAIAFLLDKTLQYDLDIQPIAFDEKDFNNYLENPFISDIVATGIKIV